MTGKLRLRRKRYTASPREEQYRGAKRQPIGSMEGALCLFAAHIRHEPCIPPRKELDGADVAPARKVVAKGMLSNAAIQAADTEVGGARILYGVQGGAGTLCCARRLVPA